MKKKNTILVLMSNSFAAKIKAAIHLKYIIKTQSIFSILFFGVFCCFYSSPAYPGKFNLPTQIELKLENFRKLPNPAVQDRVKKIELLITKLEQLELPSVVEGMANSDLTNTTALEIIKKHSRGIVAISDLQSLPISGGYSLGLSARSGIYEMLSERFNLIPWTTAYPEFGIDWHKVKNHTEIFLSRVYETGRPIIFFLPKKTISYSGISVTVDELKWLIEDENRLKNVYFIFGAYDLITAELEQAREAAGFSSDEFRALFLRALGATSSSYDQAI